MPRRPASLRPGLLRGGYGETDSAPGAPRFDGCAKSAGFQHLFEAVALPHHGQHPLRSELRPREEGCLETEQEDCPAGRFWPSRSAQSCGVSGGARQPVRSCTSSGSTGYPGWVVAAARQVGCRSQHQGFDFLAAGPPLLEALLPHRSAWPPGICQRDSGSSCPSPRWAEPPQVPGSIVDGTQAAA
jgi:hypothetical protein